MSTIKEQIDNILEQLDKPINHNISTNCVCHKDLQEIMKDSIDIIKDVDDKCDDLQVQIVDVQERVTTLEQ